MKKVFFTAFLLLMAVASINAQGQFRAGISGGLPIGDAGDFATFAIAVDLGYLFEISDDFQAGPQAGYSHSFGDSVDTPIGPIDIDDVQFIPVGGRAVYNISDQFSLQGDIGYGIGINDGNDGGFYYSPRAAYGVSEAIDIVVAFRSVSQDGGSWDIISAGIEFGID